MECSINLSSAEKKKIVVNNFSLKIFNLFNFNSLTIIYTVNDTTLIFRYIIVYCCRFCFY